MKIRFGIGPEAGSMVVQKEHSDRKARCSGFTRGTSSEGWGAEIHLLYLILQVLNAAGFNLSSIKLAADKQMYGDDHMRYLRTPKKSLRKAKVLFPYIYVVDGNYALRSSAEVYNKGEEVRFEVHGNVFAEDYPQPDWYNKLKLLCDASEDVECTLYGDAVEQELAEQKETADAKP